MQPASLVAQLSESFIVRILSSSVDFTLQGPPTLERRRHLSCEQASGAFDECHRIALRLTVHGATHRQLLMTGSLHWSIQKFALRRVPQSSSSRLRGRNFSPQQNQAISAIRADVTSTGSSGSSSDGSDTSTNALRKGPGSLRKKDFRKFVHFFRQASPYIEGHRDKTFVIVIPGEVRHPSDSLLA